MHAPTTLALLDAVGVAAGARCIDLGCGGGHVTIERGRRAGPAGCAVGIDLDETLLECTRQDAAAQGLDTVTFRVAAAEDLAEAGFDLAFARFLLSHLPDPARVAGLMVAAVRSGGIVVVEDTEFSGCFTSPCPSYDHWVSWYRETVRSTGGYADLGPRLPALLRSVGLTDLGVRVVQHAYLDGPHKRLQGMSMDKQKAAVVAAGVASTDDSDAARTELQAFTADPDHAHRRTEDHSSMGPARITLRESCRDAFTAILHTRRARSRLDSYAPNARTEHHQMSAARRALPTRPCARDRSPVT